MNVNFDQYQGTILIVDDTPENLEVLFHCLTNIGFRILVAEDAVKAIQIAENVGPDLILLDVLMPEVDGFETCHRLKAKPSTVAIPIIFMTALADIESKVKGLSLGAVDYITKPLQIEEVAARVKLHMNLCNLHKMLMAQNASLKQEIEARSQAEAALQQRTLELQRSLDCSAVSQRITAKVRDSLDEKQIFPNAIAEITTVLQATYGYAALYDAEQTTATICAESNRISLDSSLGQVLTDFDQSEIHQQLLCGQTIQVMAPEPCLYPTAIAPLGSGLFCPIWDSDTAIGFLAVFQSTQAVFSDLDVQLVQQIANQCAIATRQARLYQSVQTQVHELEKLNCLKDDFLSTVSHELRAPMASIKMATQMLKVLLQQEGEISSTRQRAAQYFKILGEECQREINLINDLLALSHLDGSTDSLAPKPLNLQTWAIDVAQPFLSHTQKHQQQLQFDLPDDLPPLATDPVRLERILTELLHNACKYTPAGEKIIVSARVKDTHLQLWVSNSGVELPAHEQTRIFEKFYRIPHHDPWKYGGTGLGLALVKKLTEGLGAEIQVESGHQITRFILTFPLSQSQKHSPTLPSLRSKSHVDS